MENITINGSPNTSKVVVIDGMNVIDELGTQALVNPNIDAVGEVQVISSGYTAENGRSSGGMIIMTTKSGTNQFKGSGWYNARREEWNANEYFRIKNELAKSRLPREHSGLQHRRAGGHPEAARPRQGVLLRVAGVHRRPAACDVLTHELSDGARAAGDFSQTYSGNANGPGQGTLQQIINPDTGLPFPGNKIPLSCAGIAGCDNGYINPLGQQMLNLLPMPNGYFNPANNQYNAANYHVDTMPYHSRTNNTLRLDVVLNNKRARQLPVHQGSRGQHQQQRRSRRASAGRTTPCRATCPGSVTQVLGPTLVNEITVGFAHNSYGWSSDDGEYNEDYSRYYRSAVGVDPPRLEPFGEYRDPQGLGYDQSDEYRTCRPWRTVQAATAPNAGELQPGTSGRTAFCRRRIATIAGRSRTTCPGRSAGTTSSSASSPSGRRRPSRSARTTAGNYNFGHNAQNPLSTGNGYANALLGVFTTYTELTNRVDRDRRHWQTEGYVQDSWRMKPGLDARLRRAVDAHAARTSTRGSRRPASTSRTGSRARRRASTGRPARPAWPGTRPAPPTTSGHTIRPTPAVLLSSAFIGNLVPGIGLADQRHGRRRLSRHAAGRVLQLHAVRRGAARRLRVGHQRRRQAGAACVDGHLLRDSHTRAHGKGFVGTPPAAFNRQVRWATFGDIENFAASGKTFVETPINAQYAGGETRSLEKSYNLNVAYQRDIGFSTTAEVAYVGSWTYTGGRTEDINRPVNNVYLLADPSRMFNGNGLDTNFLRTNYPGMGSINQWRDAKDGYTVNNNTLRYNAMQVNVQRRLNRGLQMGLAYTLAKGVGWTGYNPDYLEADPTGELNKLRLWGPTANDRTHNLVINYSYVMPNPTPGVAVLNAILGDWMVSGVTKYLSGAATQPSCTTTTPGIANTNPTLTPGATAACVYTGEPVFDVTRDPNLPEEDQLHFNPARVRDGAAAQRDGRQLRRRAAGHPAPPGLLELGPDAPASLPDSGTRAAGAGAAATAAVQHLQHAAVHHPEHGADVPGRSERAGARQPAADEHEAGAVHSRQPAARVRRHVPRGLLVGRVGRAEWVGRVRRVGRVSSTSSGLIAA